MAERIEALDTISRREAIDANGLDEEIRCEMCKNPMQTDRGCDGNCKYDEILYEKIIQILNKRITPLPSAHPVITCDGCRFVGTYDTDPPCRCCIRREKDYYEKE